MHNRFRQGRRRRVTKFAISELSAVDSPAQEGATAVLVKRRSSAAKQLVIELPNNLTADDRAELVEMAEAVGRAQDGVAADLLRRLFAARAAQLGVTARDPADAASGLPSAKRREPRAALARLLS